MSEENNCEQFREDFEKIGSLIFELSEKRLKRPYGKGAIYFSPLVSSGVEENRGMVRKFYRVKTLSPIPTFLYLIQRL